MVKPLTATSPNKLASSARPTGEHPVKSDVSPDVDAMRSAFRGAAIGMSWQLAVIVLVCILGGYKLDDMTGSSPVFTLIGLVLALAGSIVVIRSALSKMNNFEVKSDDN